MAVAIRPASLEDLDTAVPLLLQAGETLLTRIFGKGKREQALDYLKFAWRFGAGQYGFENHWVATDAAQIAGIITSWHDALPDDFDRLTLTTVTEYYGFQGAMDIVSQNQALTENLHAPDNTQLAIGHLSVASEHQRKGVGQRLVAAMEQRARQLNKSTLVLDVEQDNRQAMMFYRSIGFTQVRRSPPFVQLRKAIAPDTDRNDV